MPLSRRYGYAQTFFGQTECAARLENRYARQALQSVQWILSIRQPADRPGRLLRIPEASAILVQRSQPLRMKQIDFCVQVESVKIFVMIH